MVARRALHSAHGPAGMYLVRPFVVMAARALGPGPTRLKLIKLAHNLDGGPQILTSEHGLAYAEERVVDAQPTQRAA